jgi:hypothetical protein
MAKLAVLSFLATGVISAAPVYQLDSIFAGGNFFDGFDFATVGCHDQALPCSDLTVDREPIRMVVMSRMSRFPIQEHRNTN